MSNFQLKNSSFFSVAFELILIDVPLPYDLYINSSTLEERERFVRIFPGQGILRAKDRENFQKKYHRLYIPETQRGAYLKSLVKHDNCTDQEKAKVIKDSAIHYLGHLFEKDYSNELLVETIKGCKDAVESLVDTIKDYEVDQIQALIGDLSFHDFYTYDHSINVAMYSIAIYRALRPHAPKDELILAGLGGMLHDLGKIKIPTEIINNPGKLTDEEFAIIKQHPDFGKGLLGEKACHCEGVDLGILSRVVHEHHENVNGTGYPLGLKGEDIHLFARITAIADFFDAITTKRSYHEALSTEDAIAVMQKSVGKKIDPFLFKVFTDNISKLIFKGKTNQELPEDFDPCRPYEQLPLKLAHGEVKEKDIFHKKQQDDFGKIKVDTEPKKRKKKRIA